MYICVICILYICVQFSDFRLRFQVKSLPSSEMLIGFFMLAVFSTVVFKSNAFSSMSFN